ncbi:peptidase M23 [Bacillus sp. FJAT-27225]|uniref:M23 family metallopeptidase n=1 Tax=Bacillus sp. FJAT-27225 TaxID=1743144 RepID=UPI00080C29C8|nr:M23 family metallopeptidase [Bacillus sp. FJAT-27225]OCA91249.1 peptidase M23 [Bacillus sp. FJAT-27225]
MQPSKEEIRRRIAKRKKERGRTSNRRPDKTVKTPVPGWLQEDEKYGFNEMISYESGPDEGGHPLFKKEVFFFKLLAAAVLFLVIAIMFRSQSPTVEPVKEVVLKGFTEDFQFATVSKWYEDKFGKPLALLPDPKEKKPVQSDLALPASGKILENFAKNGQGIMIETEKDAPVEAIDEGLVIFASTKEGLGKTVVIQHGDKSESWYGNLDKISVGLYDHVGKAKEIGQVGPGADETKGEFYFAIKKKEGFIDPIQVISFE